MSKVKVLFVCLGNICRSPLAEGVFKKKVEEKGLADRFVIDSCGTSNYHIGEQPDRRTIKNALVNGVRLNHQGRQFAVQDFNDYDYIVAMDASNRRDIEYLRPVDCIKKVWLMRNFDNSGLNKDVPDPYYGGENGFQEVFDIIDESADGLLTFLIEENRF
ncbi:protein tyrosine phosphatase [Roseivirga ehrenbergii]|uniref:protein-tyrosine-phosphatase n=1 Tax=Roseivirga ehrenbergii (strain DSM 102268 / JCM 13514 / KCTC 12282 / NCIMB 14502 / KMM 6017) TaxID=279360 RepID=A0A150WZD8_ROSEK|nr:low molecular weight protein-tyrosine-phosphatase [Roseivirga ehrenbergii]KYG71786.1 protein tyrosine phosphatase [Roseivirga ehrenbergii]